MKHTVLTTNLTEGPILAPTPVINFYQNMSVYVYVTYMYLFGLSERKDYAQSRLLNICLISKH